MMRPRGFPRAAWFRMSLHARRQWPLQFRLRRTYGIATIDAATLNVSKRRCSPAAPMPPPSSDLLPNGAGAQA